MKKLFTLFLALALVVSIGIVGCGGDVDNSTQSVDAKGKRPPENTPAEDQNGGGKDKDATIANGTGEVTTPPK